MKPDIGCVALPTAIEQRKRLDARLNEPTIILIDGACVINDTHKSSWIVDVDFS